MECLSFPSMNVKWLNHYEKQLGSLTVAHIPPI